MNAAASPILRLLPNAAETIPTSVGPAEQPTSPARASMAKSALPPLGQFLVAILNVPGQKIPTDKPQSAQPKRLSKGRDEKAASR